MFTKRSPEHVRHAGNEPADVQRLRFERLLSRKREQSLGQRFCSSGSCHRVAHGAPEPIGIEWRSAQASLQRLQISDDDGE